jgi:hypothetical protein
MNSFSKEEKAILLIALREFKEKTNNIGWPTETEVQRIMNKVKAIETFEDTVDKLKAAEVRLSEKDS